MGWLWVLLKKVYNVPSLINKVNQMPCISSQIRKQDQEFSHTVILPPYGECSFLKQIINIVAIAWHSSLFRWRWLRCSIARHYRYVLFSTYQLPMDCLTTNCSLTISVKLMVYDINKNKCFRYFRWDCKLTTIDSLQCFISNDFWNKRIR